MSVGHSSELCESRAESIKTPYGVWSCELWVVWGEEPCITWSQHPPTGRDTLGVKLPARPRSILSTLFARYSSDAAPLAGCHCQYCSKLCYSFVCVMFSLLQSRPDLSRCICTQPQLLQLYNENNATHVRHCQWFQNKVLEPMTFVSYYNKQTKRSTIQH